MTTIFDKCENILQSSGSETSLGSASAPAHFFLVPLVSLVVPGVLPVPRHGPVGGAPAPSVLARSAARSGSLRSAVSSSPGPAAVPLLASVAHLHFNSKSFNVIGRKMVEKGRNIRHSRNIRVFHLEISSTGEEGLLDL